MNTPQILNHTLPHPLPTPHPFNGGLIPEEPADIREAAESYHERGWVPVPVPHKEKGPHVIGWQNRTLDTPLDDFPRKGNISILLGEPSGGLVDIDLDCPEAIELAPEILPDTPCTFGHVSKPKSHWIYRAKNCGKTDRFQAPADGMLVEYRATGATTVFPPSTHVSGEAIRFDGDEDAEPAEMDAEELREAVKALAAASLLVSGWAKGSRHDLALAVSSVMLRSGHSEEETQDFLRAICRVAKDDGVDDRLRGVRDTAKRLRSGEPTTGIPSMASIIGADIAGKVSEWIGVNQIPEANPQNVLIECTEVGNSERFVQEHGREAKFCPEDDSWYLWTGTRWSRDDTGQIQQLAETSARRQFDFLSRIRDTRERDVRAKWAQQSCTRRNIDNTVALSRAKLAVPADKFDGDSYLLNFTNGTLDLHTGELRTHNPEDMITRSIDFDYVANAECPRFMQFLWETTADDVDLARYLQRALGYSLTGDTGEQCLFLAHGSGANGKSTLLNLFQAMLGGYARNTPVQTLLAKKSDGGASNDLVRLRSARFVTATEAEANQKLAESLLKQVTGGDTVTARALYHEYVEFKPEFKLWLATNHMPKVNGGDPAMWRRLHMIPFNTVIPPERRDPDLPKKLLEEAPGIMAWAVQGCLEWQQLRLSPPAAVTNATNAYRDAMDDVKSFLNEAVLMPADGTVSKADMFTAYRRWTAVNGAETLSKRELGSRLISCGLTDRKSNGTRVWDKVALLEKADTFTQW